MPSTPQLTCQQCGAPFSTAGRASKANRFCTSSCYQAWRRTPRAHPCAQCGQQIQHRPGGRVRRFCSTACSGLFHRAREARICEICHAMFEAKRSDVELGRGRYCSNACRQIGHRRRISVTCERCNTAFTTHRSRPRRFCSWACYLGSERGCTPVACLTCGKVRQVENSTLRAHRGGFCSRDCANSARRHRAVTQACAQCGESFVAGADRQRRRQRFCSRTCNGRSRAQARVQVACERCGNDFPALPRDAERRRFCSTACFAAFGPRTIVCQECGHKRSVPRRKKAQRFCSISCANRGRQLQLASRDRNELILALRRQNLKTPAIQQQLQAENSEWWLSTTAIRQVIVRGGLSKPRQAAASELSHSA